VICGTFSPPPPPPPPAAVHVRSQQAQLTIKKETAPRIFSSTMELLQYKAQRKREADEAKQLAHMPSPKTFETATSRTASDAANRSSGAIGGESRNADLQPSGMNTADSDNKRQERTKRTHLSSFQIIKTKNSSASEASVENFSVEQPTDSATSLNLCRVVPLILWDEKDQKYKMGDPAEWQLPQGLKVIAVSGSMRSGATTFIHDQIMDFGYQFTENQIAATLFKVGVVMYVLEKEKVVFLDICDNIDNISGALDSSDCTEEEKLEQGFCPAGNFLLDLFGFAASTHFILHCSIDPELLEVDSQSITKQFIYAKMKFLACNVDKFLQRGGPAQLSVVLRAKKSKLIALYADVWDETILLKSTTVESDSSQDDVGEDKKLMQLFPVRRFYPLKYYPDQELTVHWPQVWRELSENEELQATLLKYANECAMLKEAQDWCHAKTEEFQQSAEDMRDPTTPFQCILKFAEVILRTGLSISNPREVELKNRCLETSLRGYTVLIWCEDPMLEFLFARLAINEFSALSLLTDEAVCTMFDGAWMFLARAADFGYKLSLARHGVVGIAIRCLASNRFFPESSRMRFYILLTLRNMVENDVRFPMSTYANDFTGKYQLPQSEVNFEKLLCEVSFDAKELAEKLALNAFERAGETVSEDEFIKKYKEVIQKKLRCDPDHLTTQAVRMKNTDADTQKRWQRITEAFFNRLFFEIGTRTARQILELRNDESPNAYQIFREKLCRNDPDPDCLRQQACIIHCMLQLEETNLSKIIINIQKLRDFVVYQLRNFVDLPSYRAVLGLAARAMHEEHRMRNEGEKQQQQPEEKVQDMNTMRRQEQRLLEKQQFGELQLLLLRNDCLQPILDTLLKRAIKDSDTPTTIFSHVLTELLLSSEEEEYKKLSLAIFAQQIGGVRAHAIDQLSRCLPSETETKEPFAGCYRSASAALMLYNKLSAVYFRCCDSDGDLSLEFLRLFYKKLSTEDKTEYAKAAISSEAVETAVKLVLDPNRFTDQDGAELKFQTLIFLWNLQETSGLSLIDAKRKHLGQNIGSLSDVRNVKLYWHKRQVADERVGFSEEQVARLLLFLESSSDTDKVASLLELNLAFRWGAKHAKDFRELQDERQKLWKEAKVRFQATQARNARLRRFERKN
uniref:ANK_REP_REGION domain-containing protein n=1 Tax=Macrostomum lignano TaxID=282301 RepID=A0A1I8GWM9_9PLAT